LSCTALTNQEKNKNKPYAMIAAKVKAQKMDKSMKDKQKSHTKHISKMQHQSKKIQKKLKSRSKAKRS
jgi:hypothetical protein